MITDEWQDGFDEGFDEGCKEADANWRCEVRELNEQIVDLNNQLEQSRPNPIRLTFEEKVFDILNKYKNKHVMSDLVIENIENELDIFLQCGV